MGLANLPWECDEPMYPWNGTNQCALGIRLSNVCWLANVPWEWDYPMCSGNGTIQLANVPCEWD